MTTPLLLSLRSALEAIEEARAEGADWGYIANARWFVAHAIMAAGGGGVGCINGFLCDDCTPVAVPGLFEVAVVEFPAFAVAELVEDGAA